MINADFNFIKPISKNKIVRAEILAKWRPYLRDYLVAVIDKVYDDKIFYHELIGLSNEDRSKNSIFINKFLSKEKNNKDGALISKNMLTGKVGIGKSFFINWFRDQNNLTKFSVKINLENEDTEKLLNASDCLATDFIKERVWRSILTSGFLSEPKFKRIFNEKIKELLQGQAITTFSGTADEVKFVEGFISQRASFLSEYPFFNSELLVVCLITTVNAHYKRPIWVFIDNVDLESASKQSIFIRAGGALFDLIKETCDRLGWRLNFHLLIAMRPETFLAWKTYADDYEKIVYEEPDVVEIAKRKINNSLIRAADEQSPDLEFFSYTLMGKEIKNYKELALHISESINVYITPGTDWYFDMSTNKFHLDLVDSNVRKFMDCWTNFFLSENFIILLNQSNQIGDKKYINTNIYLNRLIRGPYTQFVGNFNPFRTNMIRDEMLFFNIFGFPLETGSDKYILFYFIYLRILQYLTYWYRS